MIYTVTLNPSIDYVVTVPSFQNGELNRSQEEAFFPGGKGINVSVVLKNLGVESTALGFVAGFTGDKIEAMLREKEILTDFIKLPEGNSRVNVKMHSLADGVETEINGNGPQIPPEYVSRLKDELCKLKEGDTLILAGSIPSSVSESVYEEICNMLSGKGVRIVVDAEKRLAERVLKYKPFLIKPNHHELGEMFGVQLDTREEALIYARKLRTRGAGNIIVSMAGNGAVYVGEDGEEYEMDAPEGTVVNSVGSGDSMVAGFLAALNTSANEQEKRMETAFRTAVCAGSACAFLQGLPERGDVEKLIKENGR